jgi:hypothetical protein
MSKTGLVFKSTRKQKEEARRRLKAQQQERGSDEEYYSHLLNQYVTFEDTRRRAISAESNLSNKCFSLVIKKYESLRKNFIKCFFIIS